MQGKIERTSRGLVDGLFDAIDRLNNKQIDVEQARALSHTARTIVSVATLELEYRKWKQDNSELPPLQTLQLDPPKENP